MNEEAIQYSYELFKKDGYEGNIDQYKTLLNENRDAFNHSYKLFKDDGYDGGEEGFKGLVIAQPVEPKKETAVSMESQSYSAQNNGVSGSPVETNNTEQQQPNVEGKLTPQESGDGIVQQIEAREQEPDLEMVQLFEDYKKSGEITIEDRQQVAQKVADQGKGEGRSWYETAGAYVDGLLRTGMPIPIYKYWEPECVLIEAKASGTPLTHELRQMGIPVVNYSPSRGNDKYTRVNTISPILEGGLVWAPDTSWAEDVIEECAAFPSGEHDDYVDTVTQALRRFREGGFIAHPEDWQEDTDRYVAQHVYY